MPSDLSQFWQWNLALFVVEALLVVAALAFHWHFPGVERTWKRFAGHPLAPAAVGVFALALRASVLPIEPVPAPWVHDEFSYLLQADTFAHGRLANATHPMWEHFETYHEDQLPTYASMYPPLPGMVLAAGQVVAGTPFAAVWLSVGLMCAVLCWALGGWFPPGWAMLAGVIAAMRLAMFSYWGDSYWGGALAAIGGALLFGALPRLIRTSRRRDALLAALGVVILLNTRPYEGLVFSVAVGLVALWYVRKLRLRTILPPACAVLVCAGALMAYYNWRVFGSPTTLPYTVNRRTYAVAPVFVFQSPGPPVIYRHREMQEFYTKWELETYEWARTWNGFFHVSLQKLYWGWSFFLGPVLTLPLLAFLWTWKSRRTRILLFVGALTLSANLVVAFFQPHYMAPATVVLYAAILQGMRVLFRLAPRVARAIPVICVVMIVVRVALAVMSVPPDVSPTKTWARDSRLFPSHEIISEQILEEGGQHLVIVHYGPGHDVHDEFVFNAADIDASPIVWARDMGPEKNAELVRYFHSRKVWLLNLGWNRTLSAYPPQ